MAVNLDSLILGVNPFAGVDHFSNEKAREKMVRLSTETISDTMRQAFAAGATGFNFATDERGYDFVHVLANLSLARPVGLYAMVPDVSKYVTAQLTKGTFGMITEALSELTWRGKTSTLIQGGLSFLTSDPIRAIKVFLDVEISKLLGSVPPNAKLKTVLVHEALTDTALAIGATRFFKTFVDHILDKRLSPGFVTRNFPQFVAFFEQNSLPIENVVIMTPFNKLGFQMTPNREECEQTLRRSINANVIGMSVLAAGQIGLADAASYVRSLKNLRSVVLGVSTPSHARETFETMGRITN